MKAADLTIVHPWDPWHQGIGGFDACLDGMLRVAPGAWGIELIGISADPSRRTIGQWQSLTFAGREVAFFPVLREADPDRVRSIPLSLRFALGARRFGVRARGRIFQYHRFESAIAVPPRRGAHQAYFLHNHPVEQVESPHSELRWRNLAWLYRFLLLRHLRNASLVVAVDPRTPAWIEEVLPAQRGSVVHQKQWADREVFNLGSDTARRDARIELRADLGAPETASVVLFVGRLERQKDPGLAMRAFAGLAQEDVHMAVVGQGRMEGEMRELAGGLGVGARVHFLGPQPRQEMPKYYRGADVLLCSSGFEAGPRTVVESLACGTAVVSLDVGQVSQVMAGDDSLGEIVHQRDALNLAQALERVLKSDSAAASEHRSRAVSSLTAPAGLAPVFDRYATLLDKAGDADG